MKLFLVVITFLTLISCTNSPGRVSLEDLPVINLDTMHIADSLSSICMESYKIPLELTSNALISNIDQIRVNENDIFVMDKRQKSVFRFNRDGRYLSKIHSVGQGPGEYINIMDFLLKDDNVYLLDFRGAILVYDYEGQFIEKIDLPFQANYFEYLGESKFIFQDIRIDGTMKYVAGIYCLNKKEVIDSIGITEGINDDSYPFMRLKHLWLDGKEVYFNYNYSDIVYRVTNTQISPLFRILSDDFPDIAKIKYYAENPVEKQKDTFNKLFYLFSIFECDNTFSFTCILNNRFVRVFYSEADKSVQGFRECSFNTYSYKNQGEVISYSFIGLVRDVDENPIVFITELK